MQGVGEGSRLGFLSFFSQHSLFLSSHSEPITPSLFLSQLLFRGPVQFVANFPGGPVLDRSRTRSLTSALSTIYGWRLVPYKERCYFVLETSSNSRSSTQRRMRFTRIAAERGQPIFSKAATAPLPAFELVNVAEIDSSLTRT